MKELIAALKKTNRKDLATKIKKILSVTITDTENLPDTSEKIIALRQFLQEAFARQLKEKPQNRLKGILENDELFSELRKLEETFKLKLIDRSDYNLMIYWITRSFIEKLIVEYDNLPGAFPIQLDTVSLREIIQQV